MTIKYFSDIRPLTGVHEEEWHQPHPDILSLLRALGQRHVHLEKRVFEGDQLSSTMIILVNGRNIEFLSGVATPLTPDDVVDLFPVEGGG